MMRTVRTAQFPPLFFVWRKISRALSSRPRQSGLSVLGLLGTSLVPAAFAQTPVTPPASATSAVGAVAPYVDRVIEGLSTDNGLDLKASEFNSSGWPRSWHLDYSLFSQRSESRTQSRAIGLSGFIDTPNYGSISANGSFVSQQLEATGQSATGSSSTWRIDQRAVPLGAGWRANYSAGDINSGLTSLGRGTGRVSLPSSPIRGLAGQWYLGDTTDLNFASGQTGLFNGISVPGFETSGGQITSAGAQTRLPWTSGSSRADAAIQLIDGRKISDGSSLLDTQGVWLSAAWEGASPWADATIKAGIPPAEKPGGLRVQTNVVKSTSSQGNTAVGLWADANWRTERWRNTAGVFRFEPNLRWGSSVLASDLQGAYWQADTSTRQWQAGFSTELTDSVSNSSNSGGLSSSGKSAFINLNGRYRLDSRNTLGAGLNLRAISSPGQSLLLTWDRQTDLGETQWRIDFAKTGEQHIRRVGLDHSWALTPPASFSTSLALERIAGGALPGSGVIWGLLGTASPWSQWSIDASLRGERRSIGSESVNANLGLSWQSFNGWSLALRYTETRGQDVQQTLVVSALTAATLPLVVNTPASRSLQLVLRYDGKAGSPSAPLGGSQGSGAGSLSGAVFFDTDNNGKREATEGGVAGVTVILDRRYVTRTDAQGKYSFPFVAAGQHLVEISSDNVPLPWSPLLRDAVKTEVLVRDNTILDFAVQREK